MGLANRRRCVDLASAGAILACAFSPDGTQLLLGGIDRQKQLTLWDTRSGAQVGEFKGHVVSAWCCSYSGDGRRIISAEGSKGFIAVWDTETRSQLFRKFYRGNAVVKCSLSPDGRTVAVLRQDDTVELWDVDDDKELATLITNLKEIWGFQPLAACTYSPDGNRILSAAQDGALRVWSINEIAHVSPPQHTGRVEELRSAPDGRRFLSRSAGARRNDNKQQTMLWDAETRTEILPIRYENGRPEWDVDTASFDPAPTEKGSLRAQDTGPMLEISDTATGAVTGRFKVMGTVTAFAWGEQGLIVVGDSVGFLYFLRLRER